MTGENVRILRILLGDMVINRRSVGIEVSWG